MKKKLNVTIWISFWTIFLEFVYRIFIVKEFFTINTLSVVLFSIPWICLFSIMCSVLKEKGNKILTIIYTFVSMIITLAQIVYFNFYNSIFSFFSLTTGTGQVMQFWQMIIEVILRIWYIFVLVLVPFILFLIFNKKIINFERINKKKLIIILGTLIVSLFGIVIRIKVDSKGVYSLKRLLYETHAPMLTINKTGLNTMQAIDLYRCVFGFEEKIIEVEEPEDDVIIEEIKPIEYNVLDINFEELYNNETKKKVKKLHDYFKNTEPTEKNDYTGLFKGKNLIFITAEAFDTIAIDENITPTLYKMANNSFVFNNYYQPLYPISTSDGEYMNLMGLIPKEGLWSLADTWNNDMKFAIGNMFNRNGYISYAFHNHTHKYYDRHKSHPNLGFKYMGCGNGLEKLMNCKRWPNSDQEMFKATTKFYMTQEEPFLAYYMTVSGHLNYNFGGNNMASRHKKLVSNLPYSTAIKAYYATQIELDKSLEYLLAELEKNGKLEDTLIVIAPDHYPYGLTKKQMNEVSKINRDNKFEVYHTSLIIYNPSIERTEINETISGIDILPTIYNLYGIDYDSRLYMGRDIFSEQEHIVILSDRSWITSKGRYNSVNGKFTKTTDEEFDQEEYIQRVNKIANDRFTISSSILDNDYYKYLELE